MTLYMHAPSAGGVIIHEGNVLVITSPLRGSVDLPKGTIEQGESIQETALREVEEETGYRTRIMSDLGSMTYDYDSKDGRRYRKTVSYFLMELADTDEPIKNLQEGEDFDNEWLTFDEAIQQLSYKNTRAIVEKVKELTTNGSY